MSEIGVGDLVYVAKPATCCGNPTALGWTFIVTEISTRGATCVYCHKEHAELCARGLPNGVVQIHRLRKIKPLSDKEREQFLFDVQNRQNFPGQL